MRQIRLRKGLTQEEFADRVGMSVEFLSLIERGINAPSFEMIERIARALRVPVKMLFTFGRTMTSGARHR